ncbi:MAG: pilus assembly protein PilM, partial [Synergistaceae bacterium]|nr:pilus assembly protein PilM [Synergistaceae bacterium]
SLLGYPGKFEVTKAVAGTLPETFSMGGDHDLGPDFRLEKIFKNIVSEIGDINTPVNIAIPATDSLLRIVQLPNVSLSEAKMAFRYDFERYFPFPVDEAVFDMAPIVFPLQSGGEEKRFMVAATRKALINEIMNAGAAQGLAISAIEPAQIALERSVTGILPGGNTAESAVYVYVSRSNSVIMLSWKGNGIFYRSLSEGFDKISPLSEEDSQQESQEYVFIRAVHSSLQFALSQIRGFEPETMYIFGPGASEELCMLFRETVKVSSVLSVEPLDVQGIRLSADDMRLGSWDIPLGLALRR